MQILFYLKNIWIREELWYTLVGAPVVQSLNRSWIFSGHPQRSHMLAKHGFIVSTRKIHVIRDLGQNIRHMMPDLCVLIIFNNKSR